MTLARTTLYITVITIRLHIHNRPTCVLYTLTAVQMGIHCSSLPTGARPIGMASSLIVTISGQICVLYTSMTPDIIFDSIFIVTLSVIYTIGIELITIRAIAFSK